MDNKDHNEFPLSTQSKLDFRKHDKCGLIAPEERDVERQEHTV